MRNVIGICNLHDDPSLGLLTKNRPCGSVTFLGRYGLIDFTLSNFSNSGIEQIYVLVKKGSIQMRNHIGSASIWTTNTIRGSINLLLNEDALPNPKFNTDIANIKANLNLDKLNFEYVVIAPSFILANIDYNPIIEKHIESGKDVTIVYSHVHNINGEYVNCDALYFDKTSKVTSVKKNLGRCKEFDMSLESFVMSKKTFVELVEKADTISEVYNLRQIINFLINNSLINVGGYKFEDYFVPVLDLEHYVKHSLALLDYKVGGAFFKKDWPIYTTTHNTPPALYGPKAEVSNSIIANGAIINGKVKNSIISRDVIIEEGADVSDCIIFTKSVIGKNVKMKYVLTDKEVKVIESKNNIGTKEQFLYIKFGAKI